MGYRWLSPAGDLEDLSTSASEECPERCREVKHLGFIGLIGFICIYII